MNQFTASLWGDEAFSAVLSQKSVPDIISTITRDTSPPLFNIIEHFWFRIFGSSEVSIRSLVFVLFLITIFFIYKIGTVLWDKRTGFLAASLAFLNPFFFSYAFEGRMYSLMAATVAASMYFFIKNFVLKKSTFTTLFGYVIATALALYSHHFAIFMLFVQGLWFLKEFLFGDRKVSLTLFKSFLAIGILYIPWVIPLYQQTKMVGGGFWLGTPTLIDLRNLIYKYLAEGINSPLGEPALYLVGIILIFRTWLKGPGKSFIIGSWFLLPILLTWVISQKFTPIFFERYLVYTAPAAMILAASEKRSVSKYLIALLIALFLIIDFGYYTHPTKRPFKELASYVLETKKGDDFLINWNSSAHHLWESKYYKLNAPLYIPGSKDLPFFVGTALMTKDDILRQIPPKIGMARVNRVGVITSGPVDEITIAGYTKGEVKTFGELKYVLFVK